MPGKWVKVLVAVAALAAMGLGAALVYDRLSAGARRAQGGDTYVGNVRLRLPPGYARFPIGRRGGMHDRLDLVAFAPSLQPAGDAAEPRNDLVFISLTPAEPTVDPADRPVKLYARFLEEESWSEPSGLLLRRFQAGSPYAFEDLYIAPPEGRAFSARCTRVREKPDGLPETCLTDLRIGGLDAQLRYAPDLLPQWQALIDSAQRFIGGMIR